jgi:hypothetical protein
MVRLGVGPQADRTFSAITTLKSPQRYALQWCCQSFRIECEHGGHATALFPRVRARAAVPMDLAI